MSASQMSYQRVGCADTLRHKSCGVFDGAAVDTWSTMGGQDGD